MSPGIAAGSLLLLLAGCLQPPGGPDPSGARPDAASPAADASPVRPDAPAGCQVVLEDRFDAPALDTTVWVLVEDGAATSVMTGDSLRLSAPTEDGEGWGFANLISLAEPPMTGELEAKLRVDPAGGQAGLAWHGTETDRFFMMVWDGRLSAGGKQYGGAETRPCDACVEYSPASHAYWRMRTGGGRIYFETSATRLTWEPLADLPAENPGEPAQVRVWILASAPEEVAVAIAEAAVVVCD
jgi:hypothetical protein